MGTNSINSLMMTLNLKSPRHIGEGNKKGEVISSDSPLFLQGLDESKKVSLQNLLWVNR